MSNAVRLLIWAAVLAPGFGVAQAADLPLKAPPMTAPTAWYNPFTGFTASPDSLYGEAGAVFAFNHNLDIPGWLFRIKGGGGAYDYNIVPGVKQHVTFEAGEAMIGYQTFVGRTRFTGYVGPNVESHNNSDLGAVVRGTRGGVKAQGEVFAPLSDRWYFFALGNVSSVFNTYYTQAKAGYRISDRIAAGPEVQALGNDRFDNVRLGPFVAFDIAPRAQLILSGGYSWDERRNAGNDHSGAYAGFHLRGEFN